MLLPCPECGKQVSDRASACPQCGFPIAEHLTREREANAIDLDRKSRVEAGEADCPHCNARGFIGGEEGKPFEWCTHCEHSGRVALVRSDRGYWAVAYARVASFVAGEIDTDPGIVFLGRDPPEGHRYDAAGARIRDDDQSG